MTIKVKHSKELFEEWKAFRVNVDHSLRTLSQIIQNDMELTQDQIAEFKYLAKKYKGQFNTTLTSMIQKTLHYIKACQ